MYNMCVRLCMNTSLWIVNILFTFAGGFKKDRVVVVVVVVGIIIITSI